jgi:hypothetical protein
VPDALHLRVLLALVVFVRVIRIATFDDHCPLFHQLRRDLAGRVRLGGAAAMHERRERQFSPRLAACARGHAYEALQPIRLGRCPADAASGISFQPGGRD